MIALVSPASLKGVLTPLEAAAFGLQRTNFPRRIGLFLTDRCNFACPMCAVADIRREGLARGLTPP